MKPTANSPVIGRSLRTALASAPVIFWTLDTAGVVQQSIGKGISRQGLSQRQIIGQSIFEIYKDYPPFLANVRRALAGESVQFVLETFDGVFDRRLEPIRNESGAITGVVGVSVDVTDQVRAQQALLRSEEQFRDLVQGSIQGIAIVQDYKVVFANDAAATIFGFTSLDAMRCDFTLEKFFDAGLVQEVRANVAKRLAGEPLPPYRLAQGRRLDGSPLWIEVITRVVNWSGAPALQLAFSDITARKLSELQLQRSEEQFRALTEGSLQGIVIHRDRKFLFVNQAYAKLLGYDSPREVFDLARMDDIVAPEDRQRLQEYGALRLQGLPAPENYEATSIRKDGSRVYLLVYSRLIQWQGEPAIQSAIIDITDRKRAEQSLRESEWQLSRAQEAAHIGTWYREIASGITTWSDEFSRLLGLEPGTVHPSTDNFYEFIHPEDLGDYKNHRVRALEELGHFNTHIRIRRADGQTRLMRIIADRVESEGRPVALVGTLEDITDRQEAEHRLRSSEQRYRDLVEGSVQGIAIVQDMAFQFANTAYLKMYGFESLEALQAEGGVLNLVAPHDRERLAGYAAARVAGKPAPATYEVDSLRRDGSVFTVLAMSRLVIWNERPAAQVTVIDVTERRQAEQELRSSQKLLRQVIDAVPMWIFVKDTQSNYLMVNKGMADFFGMGTEVVREMNTRQLPAPAGIVNKALEDDQKVYRTRKPLVQPVQRMHNPAGREIWYHSTKLPLFDHEGGLIGILGINRDITEQRKAEESLRLKNHAILSATEAIAFGDLQGRILEVNPAFAEMWGLPNPQAAVGRRGIEFWWTSAELELAVEAIRATGMWTGETVATRSSGERFPVEVRVSTVRDDTGQPVWLMASIVDITERKKTEERQRELEEQLFQAQKMESIGRLVGGIAHDFNNMLTPMLGYAELALAALDPADPTHRHVQVIRSAAERASDLTRKMLMFGRRKPLRKARVEIGPEVQNVVDMLQRVIHENVIIDARIDRDVGQIHADPALIHQLIMNLALNARDAMPQGGKLAISAGRITLPARGSRPGDLPPGPYVRIRVEDTGHGMDTDIVARIFDPFFTTKAEGKGTGLGLSVVYGIVNQHGGLVTVNSKPGAGTTFVVYLPAPAVAPAASPAPEGTVHGPHTATVLVVEDDPQVLSLVSAILGGLGFTLLEANGPDEALRLLGGRTTPVDLLLCDIVMPKMNGPALAKQVVARFPTTRVLFMSGYAKDVAIEHGMQEHNAALIDKPFTVEALSRAVRNALARL